MVRSMYYRYREFLNYSIVGVSLTLANWLLYACFETVMPIEFANGFSWAIVVVLAFLGNKAFVFESTNWDSASVMREAAAYLGTRSVTGIVEVGAVPLIYQMGVNQSMFGVDGMVAKILVSLFAMVLNYAGTKLFVFR